MTKNADGFIPTRVELLNSLKDYDDQTSWRQFFDTYKKLIYGEAVKAGLNDTEAQEVLQETMIAVSKSIPGFKYNPSVGSFKGWLLNGARWKIKDQFRYRKRNVRRVHEPTRTSTGTATVNRIPDPRAGDSERVWESKCKLSICERAIARVRESVNPKQYQIFDLYFLKEWPAKKVAETLGIDRSKVFLAKHRILALVIKESEKLRKKML